MGKIYNRINMSEKWSKAFGFLLIVLAFSFTTESAFSQNAALVVNASTTDGNDTVNDTVDYEVSIRNTGNVILTSVNLTNTLGVALTLSGGDIANPGVLDPDEIWKYTGVYTNPSGAAVNNTFSLTTAEITTPITYAHIEAVHEDDYSSVTIVACSVIIANDDDFSGTNINTFLGGVAGNAITNNDTLNGVPVAAGDLNITTTANPENITVGADGSVNVPVNTPAGNYTITYQICEKINPTNCDDGEIDVTVYLPPSIADVNESTPENVAITETPVLTGTPIGTPTYTITGGEDQGLFTIDAATGAVTLPGQDFENPADANGDNVYEVEVTVTDADGNTDKATVAITVTDVVETAAITLADVNESTPENVAITETPALGGATPIGVVTYTITGGEDQGLFTIDAATGAVTLPGQDFENPADANGDNVYEVEVTVTDADGNTDKATVAITVTDVVETAAITLADVNESTPENVAITETPVLTGTPIGTPTYTITGGEDQGLFTIDAATGAVTLPGQDFENPADANGDNVYEVEVTVTDADGNTDKATVAITVTDVVETAAITLADVNESTPENVAITETPALGGATPIGVVTYIITGGEDQGLFTIDAATGAVTLPGQDFENPADANGDNVYEVEVTVTDADGNTDKATVAITVTDVVETAAITLADVNESTPENVAITETPVLTGTPIGIPTYTITGGEDQGLFTIDAATGAVTLPGQDFENPADANGDNVYEVEVTVTDADGNTDKATVAITVTDVVETAAITLADVNESTPENVAITETPALGGATPIGVVTYIITGGEDQGLFTIDAATGAVTLPGQDFENPADANGDNVYEVEVTVTDADGNTDKATVAITVTDVVETAAITLADVNESTPENVAITETPALGGATPIGVVTYTITGGEDQGLFTIDAATGAVTLPGQDFENPADANGDNVYEVEVTVTDADGNTDKATVAITVTDVVETAAITLADVNESTPENVAITETPALGGATPIGVVTYTITGGEDQGLFTIDAATGAVTLPGQDFENPADANGDNVYEVEVTVTDADGNTDKATVAITVTDVVETAAITLADVNESTPENVAITETPALGGATPIGVVTYTITGGEDQGLFTIDAATGAVTLPGQDFENPADANGDNVYEVEVTVTDADGNTDKATVAITVTDVVETAAITLADVNESTPENVAITETPALGGATPIGVVTYTITGGEDQGLFTIDAATGAVTLSGQDFENPADANGDNVYEVEVTVTDADGNTDKATVAITVTDVVETAAITLADVNESTPENVAITETPALGGATPIGVVTYTITGGEDQGLFTIDAATGAVTLPGQDFENPADANGDNVYEVEVTVTDADGNTDKATVAITVTDVVETAAITLADVNESTPENVAITETPALGGATPIGVVTYTITGGEDQGLFTIDAATGAVTLPGQDFENPADANGDNVYEVEVTVTDADGNTDKATVAITVTDVVETAAITLADVNESTPENVAITETPALGGATPIGVVTYTITGGEDQGLFTIDAATGAVTLPGQDFENPADANGDNVYEVEVTVTDADGNTDKATVAITVTDVVETAAITLADVNESTPENVAITETPALGGATPIGVVTYTITGGEDQGLFTIDAATGAVTLPGQDFENPADANGDNVYEVEVTVTDADGNTDKATVAITVTDVVETAAITLADVNESTPENVAITETPALGGATPIGVVTYTITGGEDQGLFTIDAATGAVTLPGQDFENPADANGDNVYEVEVTVTDADGNTDKATVAITVTDVVETAAITLADVNESTPENVAITETPALGGATPIGVVTYTITGGEDQGLFTIDAATGAVTLPGQDFENPADANGDNVYEVEVTVTDADGNTDKATVAITVTDVVETAAITLADVNESTPENVAITETPALGGATPIGVVTYTITGGEDQGLFTIDAATGAVTLPGQDFENPADANGDNVYEVEVTVTDADGNTDKATVAITVTDVVETAAITLADVNESTPENVAITETPALGGATPIGVVTYTITGGEDQGLFTIDAATGAVTLPGQDFENPADANGDNVYEVEVTVTDADGNTDKATVAITVTDVVETAAITLADVNESTPENVAITETPALGGATPIGVVTYTITGGEDQGLFTIDAATGAVTLPGQDFENPADANGDNVYEVEVTVTDADGNTDKATVAITVTDVVETAAITLADVNESTPENVAITETPALGGATPIGVVTYTITGGEDQGLFTIDAATGAVTLPGQDFENPADANGDNVYEVEVTVTDADGNTDKATVAITVTDVVETAAITLADVNESTPENVAITETPALGGATPIGVVTYTITGGEDQGLFTIDAATGAVTLPGQDFENPADANGDNVYEVEVTVTDADGNTDKATVAITVTDVVETAAITLADVNESTPENVAITETPALGGATPIGVVTYTITGGEDQGLFTIDAATGAVTLPGQDFENPADANGDNVYEVEVTVTDADGNTDKATVAITVTDVVETAAITLADVNESTPENVAITETPALGGATPIGVVTYTITGGEDQGLFTIDAATGAVTLPGQDFENPADANGDNVYEVEVTVTDADGNTDKATVAITVTDVVETAAITLADVNESTPENVAITETPALGGATPIGVVTYTITGGEDQGLFTIDAATGAVTLPGQDFENPADANGDNVYEVEVTVTDADGNTDKATVAITVTNVNDTPTGVDDNLIVEEDSTSGIDNQINVGINDDLGIDGGDGDNYSLDPANGPNNGTVSEVSDGVFEYIPNPDFTGNDSFTYIITDANGDTDTAIVTVTVSPVPDSQDDTVTTTEDTAVIVGIYGNDNDIPTDGTLIITDPSNGTVTIDNGGTPNDPSDDVVTYTPDADFNGTDTFDYTICDNASPANCTTSTVTVTVSPVPDSQDDTVTTTEDTAVIVGIYGNDNDIPTDGTLIITDPSNGTVAIDNGGTPNDPSDDVVTYTPDADFNGTDTFDYTICDNASPANCTTSTVIVTVNATPDAVDDTEVTTEGGVSVEVDIYDNDNDIPTDGDLTTTDPENGTVTIDDGGTPNDPSDDIVTYTPDEGFTGTDTFDYTICDNASPANCSTATVTVEVTKNLDTCVVVFNEFSPNGDGINDYLKIECIEKFKDNTVEIFNRWGNTVYSVKGYSNNDPNNRFEGISNGRANIQVEKKLPVGTYFYVLDLGNGSPLRKGWIYINR
ncbi:tandem-95 repeat protein [Tenacibaculum maritimum]|uniref:Ig-like domain-containing protein n=10 Tax=Tenacibaculum maritimum TaxID=107401 RepID=UPI00388F82D2